MKYDIHTIYLKVTLEVEKHNEIMFGQGNMC